MVPGAVGKGGSRNRWGCALLMSATVAVGLFVRSRWNAEACVHLDERPV
ncbi:unnamed protein product [Gemmata massiliana]|uniref:Uncharacterized protein n=1 Tax=Gemmata massiliana TaxID=1210884 RepID=A0A6P2CXA4_9BACT|nr:unnamed protein product [Gemmata massiliana]